jgi:hypothetical protein
VVKGVSLDIHPSRPLFHVRAEDGVMHEIKLTDLKALFYVRSLDGDSTHEENRVPAPADPRSRGATIVRIVFEDGEVMVGMTIRHPPNVPFFYLVPVDVTSNNIRMLINSETVVSMTAVEQEA